MPVDNQCQVKTVARAKLLKYRTYMGFDSTICNTQHSRNFFVTGAVSECFRDFIFPRRKQMKFLAK